MNHRRDTSPDSSEQHQESVLRAEHAYQLVLLHPFTREAWENYGEPDETIDPEHSRKLAAIRTELMQRALNVRRDRK